MNRIPGFVLISKSLPREVYFSKTSKNENVNDVEWGFHKIKWHLRLLLNIKTSMEKFGWPFEPSCWTQPYHFWNQCRKESDPTKNDFEWRPLQSILSRSRNWSFSSRVVVCRIRLFPTLILKINWLGCTLKLTYSEFRLLEMDLNRQTIGSSSQPNLCA